MCSLQMLFRKVSHSWGVEAVPCHSHAAWNQFGCSLRKKVMLLCSAASVQPEDEQVEGGVTFPGEQALYWLWRYKNPP